jgi:PilZ domain
MLQGLEVHTMQALQMNTRRQPVLVWIESDTGSIARGVAASLSDSGAEIKLADDCALMRGESVAVRLSFDRSSPTVEAAGRVAWIRGSGDKASCGLEWTAVPPAVH